MTYPEGYTRSWPPYDSPSEPYDRERRDGPRWSEALREGRRLRERAAERMLGRRRFGQPFITGDRWAPDGLAWAPELRGGGIPVGWWGRP